MNNLTIMLGYCAVYAAWVLVPLLPAILIYRLFPQSDTQAQWKILGVALKAGGASGFYFTILALAFFKFIDPAIEHVKSLERPDWTVIATIKFVDVNKKEIVAAALRSSYEFIHWLMASRKSTTCAMSRRCSFRMVKSPIT